MPARSDFPVREDRRAGPAGYPEFERALHHLVPGGDPAPAGVEVGLGVRRVGLKPEEAVPLDRAGGLLPRERLHRALSQVRPV
jgi:hypothetical protein